MTLGSKVKEALHIGSKDKHAPEKEGVGPQAGAGSSQPAYNTAHGGPPGSRAGYGSGGTTDSSTPGNNPGVPTGGSSATNQPQRTFDQGYTEDEPGYSSAYRTGQPRYSDTVTEDSSAYNTNLRADTDSASWQHARELTLAAEREAAAAQLAGNKANKELAAAEKAESAVRQARAKHAEALSEADKHRRIMDDPALKESDLISARNLYQQKQASLDASSRAVQEAEEDLARQRAEADKLHPHVQKYGQQVPGLEQEYDRRLRERQAAEGEREHLVLAAQDAGKAHAGHAAQLEALEAELEARERAAALAQQQYIQARNAAQATAEDVAQLRSRLRAADEELAAHRGRAEQAEQGLPAYREAEQRALRDLENSQAEWLRLKELEQQYGNSFEDANRHLQGLQGSHGPASKELRDAQSLLSARHDDLDRARGRAVKAEGKYKELLALADRHKQYGDSAATAAAAHGEKYQALKQEAEIHGDKHVEYWTQARDFGNEGSTEATSAVQKLEAKVKQLMNENEA